MDYAIAPSSIEPSAALLGILSTKCKGNHKIIGICNVGSADYTERISKDHLYLSIINN